MFVFQYGNTAAHEAAWKGYSGAVCVLARGGADLRVLNGAGFTPLHFACQNGHNQSCREILLAGAPPDLQNTVSHLLKRFFDIGSWNDVILPLSVSMFKFYNVS